MSTTPDDQPDRPVHPPVRPPADDVVLGGSIRTGFGGGDRILEAPEQLEQLEVAALIPPLQDRARELINRDVLVIAGGSRLDGRLVAVDDEQLLLTLEDSHYRFFIDLQSVAVLAVSR